MTLPRKPILIIFLAIASIIFGFIFLLKGCLAKFDERFIKTPALLIEKNGKTVVFSIEEFEKTTSYSQSNGMTRKSVSTSYSVQINDGESAELIATEKIKNHRAIKNFPVEVLGASGATAWVFINEPMAFDAFTLDQKADIKMLEDKNPSLKGKFPAERQFYDFNRNDNNIYFTATDGSKWQLNTQTLLVSPSDYRKNESPLQHELSLLEQQLKDNQVLLDTLFQQKSYRPGQEYSAKKISYAEYQKKLWAYYNESKILYKTKDSLFAIKQGLEKNERKIEDNEREMKNLERTSPSFSQTKSNQDTISSSWLGLYGDDELEKLNDRVSNQVAYDETIRRKLFTGHYSFNRNEDAIIDKSSLKNIGGTDFLDGGFLLDKKTARPIYLPASQSWLIVHKDIVGRDGKILVTSITKDGKINWTYNTGLSQWSDWCFTGTGLYVFGVNNKKLGSDETNILLCIDPAKGTATGYDYFTKKKLE